MNCLNEVMEKTIELANMVDEARTIDEKFHFCENLLKLVDDMVEKYGPDLIGLDFSPDAFSKIDQNANEYAKRLFLFSAIVGLTNAVQRESDEGEKC